MSTLKVDNLQTTGGVGLYPARAWVNFNGTGTVSIRASGNISSITDNGTGHYTANFSSSMPDVNYAVSYSVQDGSNDVAGDYAAGYSGGRTTSGIRFYLTSPAWSTPDRDHVNLVVFR
jgi:hypothetical protein